MPEKISLQIRQLPSVEVELSRPGLSTFIEQRKTHNRTLQDPTKIRQVSTISRGVS